MSDWEEGQCSTTSDFSSTLIPKSDGEATLESFKWRSKNCWNEGAFEMFEMYSFLSELPYNDMTTSLKVVCLQLVTTVRSTEQYKV
jgi:hypothetical protein